MVAFNSIVIFDLEATGLPNYEHNMTKITEISLIGCLTSHCLNKELPRAMNKLTLVVNPMKRISPEASQITGLDNELLEEMKPFGDDVVLMMNNFFGRLLQPICLIAHNGNKFDFPIIRRQLLKCQTKLMDNIYCADSLLAFKDIFLVTDDAKEVKETKNEKLNSEINLKEESNADSNNITPKIKTMPNNIIPVKEQKSCTKSFNSSVCRKLDFVSSENSCIEMNLKANEDKPNIKKVHTGPKSKALRDIYRFLHNNKDFPDEHRAESDCLALLSCIVKCGDEFLKWISLNAQPLDNIKPLF